MKSTTAQSSLFDEEHLPVLGLPRPFDEEFQITPEPGTTRWGQWMKILRADEWWNFKTPPAVAVAVSLAWSQNIGAESMYLPLGLLLLTGVFGGAYASILNDLMDFRQDLAAGKVTGPMSLSRRARIALLVTSTATMAGTLLLLARHPVACFWFACLWAVHILYNVRPFRLKERGIAGVICIAAGEHLVPTWIAAGLVIDTSGRLPHWGWAVAATVWSVAIGMRSILWHQLKDAENDRQSGAGTFGSRFDSNVLCRLGERVVFPAEALSLGVLLAWPGIPAIWQALGLSSAIEWLRWKYLGANPTVVAPRPNHRFALLEFATVFWPFALLLAWTQRETTAWWLVAAQAVVFPQPLLLLGSHVWHWLYWNVLSPAAHGAASAVHWLGWRIRLFPAGVVRFVCTRDESNEPR